MATVERDASRMSHEQRLATVRRVTIVGAGVDLFLGLVKIIGGLLSQSHALVADGLHSLSDLGTDVLVLAAAKAAHADADEEHPYGHARIETAATVGLGIALIAVALGIAYDAVSRGWSDDPVQVPEAWAIGIAALSVAAKEVIYHYTMRYARETGSALLEANAWHSRSDAASSLVVIVGLAGALAGWPMLDLVAAAVVGLLIGRIGYRLCRDGLSELIDTGLEAEQLATIREIIGSVDGVDDLHELRTRRMGGQALIDVHITLRDPRISVSEGHQISETVRARLMRGVKEVSDVMVHIDPEDDELYPAGQHLALRDVIMARLTTAWQGLEAARFVDRVDLHYLGGKLQIEISLPPAALDELGESPDRLKSQFEEALRDDPQIGTVALLVRH